MQYRYPTGWKISLGPNPGGNSQLEKISVDILDALTNPSAYFGKPTIKNAVLNIAAGGTDSVEFSAYAGKIPIGVLGKKASDGLFEGINTTNTGGYAITAANYNDQILLQGGTISPVVLGEFNLQQALTGVGTSIAFTHSLYSQVVFYYIDGAPSANITGMVRFTTVALLNTYTDSGIGAMGGIAPAQVTLGNQILLPAQYTITGNDIVLDAAIVVSAGDTLTIIPFA